jgi:hypothetical protein
MYYLYLPATVLLLIFLYREKVKNTYHKLVQLNNIVGKRHKGFRKTIFNAIDIIYKQSLFNLSNWLNNSIEKVDKNTSILTYILERRLYKIVLDHRRGPPIVLLVTDENEEDVTNSIIPFLGPKRDWHKRDFSPKFWNKSQLSFELSNGENKVFKGEEIINLNC